MGELAMILTLTILAPLALILHYLTRWREARGLSKEDERMLEDLWQAAQKMTSRVNTLETILDDHVTDWRKKV